MFFLDASTTTDWIQSYVAIAQLVIGALTAFFLVQTFRLQAWTFKKQADATDAQVKALTLQMELATIEKKRYLYEIRPYIDYEYDYSKNLLRITPRNRDIVDAHFKILVIADGLVPLSFNPQLSPSTYPVDCGFFVDFTMKRQFHENEHMLDFATFYKDALGNSYYMGAVVIKNHPASPIGPVLLGTEVIL
ncbi:MAG TPA: hypothetical protein VGB63_15765 [Pedobacter sp.]|jgi:hypothetical protein